MNKERISREIRSNIFGKAIHYFDTIDSTSTYAKRIAGESEHGTVVVAGEQTDGHGRLGRRWESPAGQNLTFSVILKPSIEPTFLGLLPLYAGTAIATAIQNRFGIRPECKWPNDLLLEGKKFCGILSEGIFRQERCEAVIIGIGVNVNQRLFSSEFAGTATSLSIITGSDIQLEPLIAALLSELESWYRLIGERRFEEIRGAWLGFAKMIGTIVSVRSAEQVISGVAEGIDNDGALLLSTNGATQKFFAGDVTLRSRS